MALILARRPDSSARSNKKLERLIGDPIFREVQEYARGLNRHPPPAPRIIREKVVQADCTHFLLVIFKGLPRRAFSCLRFGRVFLVRLHHTRPVLH